MTAEQTGIRCPQLRLETISFFVVEDDAGKLVDITSSLEDAGLLTAGNLAVARTFSEAQDVITSQTPGSLDHNVFLLDGNLDGNSTDCMHHGADLLDILIARYHQPMSEVVDRAEEQLRVLGLNRAQREVIIPPRGAREVACERLTLDALIVGISRDKSGALRPPAQFPRISSIEAVGGVVANAVLSKRELRRVKAQQRRDEQDTQAADVRAARSAKRAQTVE